MATKLFTDSFAYDLSKNIQQDGEIFDQDVIEQSIESILSTLFGERIFRPTFGSLVPSVLFENLDEETGEELLDNALESLEIWEDRIIVLREQATIQILIDDNSIILNIPYVINQINITSIFKRKIRF